MSEKRPKRVCSPRYAVLKAKKGIKLNHWELEQLALHPYHAYDYAQVVGRFPEAEKLISECDGYSWSYVKEVVKGRWEYEAVFLKMPNVLPEYCALRGDRWDKAERKLLNYDIDLCLSYHKDVMKGVRWPELEDRLLNVRVKNGEIVSCRGGLNFYEFYWSSVLGYVENLGGGRWLEIEDRMLRRAPARTLLEYSKKLGGRLPAPLHQKMMLLSFEGKRSAKRYLRHLDRLGDRFRRYLGSLDEGEAREFLCSGTNSGGL